MADNVILPATGAGDANPKVSTKQFAGGDHGQKILLVDSTGANILTVVSDADALAAAVAAAVGSRGYEWNGASWDRARGANVFKPITDASITAGTGATVWTPTSGKKFRLMAFALSLSVAGQIIFGDNAVGTVILKTPKLAAAGVLWIGAEDLGNGLLSAAANNVLKIDVSATGNVGGFVCGVEE